MKHKKALLAVLGCVAALAVPAAVMAADDDAIVIGNTSVIDTVDPVHNGSNAWSLTADGVSETIFMQDKEGNPFPELWTLLSRKMNLPGK